MQPALFAPDWDFDDSVPAGLTLADARPYQREWADAVSRHWLTAPRCLGVASTGTGKTLTIGMIARRVIDGLLDGVVSGCRRAVLVIAHRVGLVTQTAAVAASLLPDAWVEVEQGQSRARGDGGVVVACLPSLSPGRLRALGRDRFQAVIWDECHRVGPRNKLLKRVTDFFAPDVRQLGVTATPDRGDGVGLGTVFHDVAFDYGIWQAVQDGWLVPPYLAYEVCGDVRLDGIPLGRDGDFDANAVAARMMEAGPVGAVVRAAIKWSNHANGHPGKRPTVVCCASVEHAKLCAIALNEWDRSSGTGRAAAIVDGQEPADRDAIYRAFEAGEIRYLTHFDCLTEGWDSDRPKVMINGRPTTRRWVFAQCAGRCLRPAREVARVLGSLPDAAARRDAIKNSFKSAALIVDVAGTNHKLTVDLLSCFHAPDTTDLDLSEVRHRAKTNPNRVIDPSADLAALKKIREDERARRWAGILVDCDLTTRMSDPFDVLAVCPGREPPWFRGRRPTERMMEVLLNSGIPPHEVNGMTFWRARKILDCVFTRRDQGLSTYKQVSLLRKFGVDGAQMTFDEAGQAIDRIARNGWKALVGL